MEPDNVKHGRFRNFLRYARNHRIPVHPETRKIGVTYTLIGMACIAFAETAIIPRADVGGNFALFFSFFVAFFTGTVLLLVASWFNGRDFLKITETTESRSEDQTHHITHLSIAARRGLVFWRGVIAVVGYVLYSWAKSNSQIIDNSAVFSADAIVYALIMVFFLKMKINWWQRIAIAVVFSGVCCIVSFDFLKIHTVYHNLASLGVGLASAIAWAIIILLNSVIIQHEPPLRVAFFQCLLGAICSAILVAIWVAFDPNALNLVTGNLLVYSIASGIIYAVSLLFFFTAFLYTEPFLIVMLGYSIFPLIIFFSWIMANPIRIEDLVGSTLIVLGGLTSVFVQFKEDKKNTHASVAGYPIYLSTLRDKFRALKQDFLNSRLGRFEYLAQRHEFNKLLFEYAREIEATDLEKIEMRSGEVVFHLNQLEIKMLSDRGCRSAPLEILNFCAYEKDESSIVFQIVQDGDCILDVGANLGWYSLQLAKRFKKATVHAFEPIPQTFSVLKRNVELNELKNVTLHNLALGRADGEEDFFYFTGGSAIASRKNLLEHKKASRVGCEVMTLDTVVDRLHLERLDFFKCDVEGSELDVITGGLRSLGKFLPVIYVELFHGWCEKFGYVPNDVMTLLSTLGYKGFKIHGRALVSVDNIRDTSESFNFFFMSPQKHLQFIEKFTKQT